MKTLVFGAPGSGQSSLCEAMASRLGWTHVDVDDFIWEGPSQARPKGGLRPLDERAPLLRPVLASLPNWILGGSISGWGECFVPEMDLIVFLRVPLAKRLLRIRGREEKRAGGRIEPGSDAESRLLGVSRFTEAYESRGPDQFISLVAHESWLKNVPCKVLRIDDPPSVDAALERVLAEVLG